MSIIPSIRSLFIITTGPLLLFVVAGWSQSTPSTEVAGIELTELRTMGYRIDWINQSTTTGLKLPTITDQSLYTIDSEDNLTRYDLTSGKWLWSTPVGNKVFQLRSINESLYGIWVYVVSDGAVYIVEAASGNYPSVETANSKVVDGVLERRKSHSSRHLNLEWVANTQAITDRGMLIYGSNTGDAVWFNPDIGSIENRYRIGSSVHVSPVMVEGVRDVEGSLRKAVITPAADGSVIAVDAKQMKQIWMLKLLDAVETPIACATSNNLLQGESIPRTSVFIAGSDQYLRSVDLHSGKPRWKVLTTAPLSDTPVIHGDSLYQRVPHRGLACYEAFPENISGELKWVADDVFGSVITTNATGRLVCWDKANRILQVVDTRLGGVVSTLQIPTARSLIADNDVKGSLYIITEDDMLLRLVSRHW